MTIKEIIEAKKEEFEAGFSQSWENGGWSNSDASTWLETALTEAMQAGAEEREMEIKSRVGFLRQWINERPAGARLMTSEDILNWLDIPLLPTLPANEEKV